MDSITNVLQSIADAIRAQGSSGSGQNWDSGDYKWRASASVSAGWLLCDGSIVSQSTYAGLFAVVGTAFNTGGEGVGNFRLPNLKGRVLVSYDSSQTEFDTLGETGGAKTHTLSAAEMPVHNHNIAARWVGGGSTDTNNLSYASTPVGGGGLFGSANAGSGSAHNNLQPYSVAYCYIKT